MNKSKANSVEFLFENSTSSVVRLVLEPWGESYVLPAGMEYHIVINGLTSGIPIMRWLDESIVVIYAWPDSIIQVFQEKVELSPKRDIYKGI